MWTSARRIRNCTLSATPQPTSWRRPSSACIRRLISPSALPPRTASTTTSISATPKLSDEDLANIEKEMRKIVKENLPIKPFILPRAEAVKLMEERKENYKIEHMADLAEETEFSFFQQGEYVDMCIGPHLTYTKALKAFKITQQSGAYWKNDKENKMLTRINGVAFHNQEELDAWEKEQQEARERDHRKIGKEMGLFMTDDLVGRGLPMFLPAGYTVWQELENYIKEKERARGYLHVMTPCIGTVNLYKTSGHWDHYRENMFPAMEMEGESYVLRPMNCPHHMMIYANRPHSYRDLPMRIGEIAHDFRYESSGTLKGIERGRHFCQNDAHLFCTPEQIKSEVADVCDLIFEVYKDFNITDYRCVLCLRDPADKKKYHDDDAMWNHAENALREVLTELGIHFTEEIGEAAFYGPKLDVNVKPAVGAEYTLSTCQLDFCLPAKFHLTYVDKDGTEKTPVVLHRAILGLSGPLHGLPHRGDQGQVPHLAGSTFRSRCCPSPKRRWTTPRASPRSWWRPVSVLCWTTTTRRSATRSARHSRWTVCLICWFWVPRKPRQATSPCVTARARPPRWISTPSSPR